MFSFQFERTTKRKAATQISNILGKQSHLQKGCCCPTAPSSRERKLNSTHAHFPLKKSATQRTNLSKVAGSHFLFGYFLQGRIASLARPPVPSCIPRSSVSVAFLAVFPPSCKTRDDFYGKHKIRRWETKMRLPNVITFKVACHFRNCLGDARNLPRVRPCARLSIGLATEPLACSTGRYIEQLLENRNFLLPRVRPRAMSNFFRLQVHVRTVLG